MVIKQRIFFSVRLILYPSIQLLVFFAHMYALFLIVSNNGTALSAFLTVMCLYANSEMQISKVRGYILKRSDKNGMRFL